MADRKKRRGWLIPLVLLVVLGVVVLNVLPVRDLIALNRDREAAEAELSQIQEERARLEREIQALHSLSEIERIARSDFGYVRPGETSYVVFPSDEPSLDQSSVGETEETEQEPLAQEPASFWRTVWDYMTGADTADG